VTNQGLKSPVSLKLGKYIESQSETAAIFSKSNVEPINPNLALRNPLKTIFVELISVIVKIVIDTMVSNIKKKAGYQDVIKTTAVKKTKRFK
jgi:hypothetical protein